MPDVFPREEKAKLRLLERGYDLEGLFRDWMVSICGSEERAQRFLVPSVKDKPGANPSKVRLDKIKAVARERVAREEAAVKSESVFDKSDRLFSKRLGRR